MRERFTTKNAPKVPITYLPRKEFTIFAKSIVIQHQREVIICPSQESGIVEHSNALKKCVLEALFLLSYIWFTKQICVG